MSAGKCFAAYLSSGLSVDVRNCREYWQKEYGEAGQRVPETWLELMFLHPWPERTYEAT